MKKLLVVPLLLVTTACASQSVYLGNDYSSSTYQGKHVQQSQTVTEGIVRSIRQVKIQDDPGIAAQTAGAGIGALGVIAISNGMASNPYLQGIGVIAAALGGGAVGKQVANKLYETNGYEITIQLKNGQLINLTQADISGFGLGDSVFVSRANDGTIRVYK